MNEQEERQLYLRLLKVQAALRKIQGEDREKNGVRWKPLDDAIESLEEVLGDLDDGLGDEEDEKMWEKEKLAAWRAMAAQR